VTDARCLALLDLLPGAGPKEIKRAYHRQALRCHPDHHTDDPLAEEKFKAVSRAYLCLTAGGPLDSPSPSRPAEAGFDQTDLSDIMADQETVNGVGPAMYRQEVSAQAQEAQAAKEAEQRQQEAPQQPPAERGLVVNKIV